MQLEDGSTAYIQHTVHMPQSNTILAIQADGTIADLQTDATGLDPETISVLEQYTTKVSGLAYSIGHVSSVWSILFLGELQSIFNLFITLTTCAVTGSVFCSVCQVESIDNPLSSYGRVEADNGVHMRVKYLFKLFLFRYLLFLIEL